MYSYMARTILRIVKFSHNDVIELSYFLNNIVVSIVLSL